MTDLGTGELSRSGGREALLFRENTLATKAIDEYMKLVAQDYLQQTLGEPGCQRSSGWARGPPGRSMSSWVTWILVVSGALESWDPRGNWGLPRDVRYLRRWDESWKWQVLVVMNLAPVWLRWTAGQVVRRLCASTEDCEVDPSKCPAPELPQHQARLRSTCEEVFENIIQSYK